MSADFSAGGREWCRTTILWFFRPALRPRKLLAQMAPHARLELATYRLEGGCSIQLS